MSRRIVRRSVLSNAIKVAIANNNIQDMYKYKNICDFIHSSGTSYIDMTDPNNVTRYTTRDLPTDTLYEEMVNKINSNAMITNRIKVTGDTIQLTPQQQIARPNTVQTTSRRLNVTKLRKVVGDELNEVSTTPNEIPDMWMGSIPKLQTIKETPNALLLPKYDGCSCGVRLSKINNMFVVNEALTRGADIGTTCQRSDITEKFKSISADILNLLNSSSFVFNSETPITMSDITELTIRGEIVVNNKQITANTPPAAFIAGKVNGGMDVWNQNIRHITFKPFEVMRVYSTNGSYVPTQLEVCKLFNIITADMTLHEGDVEVVKNYFDKLNNSISEPIDGIVYCSMDWRYPLYAEQTKDKQYNKYAWKPSSEGNTVLRSVDYDISRDGKLTFNFGFDKITLNGRTCKQARVVPTRLLTILSGIGLGSVITVKLGGDIMAVIDSFVPDDSVQPYTIPTNCPFCGHKLETTTTKSQVVVKCINGRCSGIMMQKMLNFLTVVGVKGIKEGKINKLKEISLKCICEAYKVPIIDILNNVSVSQFVLSLGVSTAKSVDKDISVSGINNLFTMDLAYNALDQSKGAPLYQFLKNNNDIFVKETLEYCYITRNS